MVTDRSDNKQRIGVFGGTFDPVHYGHLRAAEEVREAFDLVKVIFIPSAHPPHKEASSVSPANHRTEMVRSAISGYPAFEVSEIECRRSEASYSVVTLETIRREGYESDTLYFVLGLDAFLEIDTWWNYVRLFDLCHWVVLERPGKGRMGKKAIPRMVRGDFTYVPRHRAYLHDSGKWLYFRRFRALEISGEEIRNLVRVGRSIRFLVPEAVERYIRARSLYTGPG
jgi:nicotinate-nucleotide adenylyltransferase